MKYIILEKYINIDPQDVEQKKKYLKDVEKILSISYGNIGGPVNISSYEELLEPKYFWKLNKRDGKIVALCIYKVSNGGRKISLCGCDGTPEGKERLYALLGEDVTQEARKTWGEFSGAIEHIYKDKLGATIIPNYVAKEILNKLGKDVISLNPDGVHYTRIINGNEVEKVMLGNVPQEDSLGKMFIQESRKIRVWDKTLTEAKEDKEKFKNWIEDGVANSSLREQPQIVDVLVNKFVELKPRIKSPYNDFYYWIKNSTFDDFWNYLMGLIQEINHKDEIKQKEKDGAELIYSDDTWKVYYITNYEASAKYGKGTKWCITGTKRWNDGTTGKETFQDYHDKNNVEFYFYLNKNGDKYALALYPNGKSYEIFNAEDVSCAYIPDAPKVEGLPDVSLKDDKKVLINALASDKIDDDIILNAIEELAYGKGEDDFDIIFALTSDEVSSIMNEKIPDSYLEYRAVARGEMTPDEYKSITGDTITDLDISNGYFWGGDLPEVEVDEDKFLTKKEACDPKNYQGHKYWYFFEDRTSWNPYELYWADDKVGLYNSLRQLMGFDDMYSFLEALADTLIYEVKEGKLGLDKLSGSVSKEYIDNLEESFIKEDVNQDISNVSNAFGTTKEPFLGPSYILPNGKFLKIRNADINISNNGSGDRGLIIHLDVQKWINKQQGKEEKYVDDIGLEEKCIRVNTDQLEHYIVLPKERPNDKQLKSLRDWIDFFYAKTSSDLVLVSYYGPTTTYFKGAVAEDIIEDIKNYYARGMFFENLKEYMDEVTIEKNGEDFPVFATDETYRLKNLLVKGDKAYRIYNDDETYYFQDAAGNKTHYEMLRLALRNGWLANSKLRDGDEDDLTSGTISPEAYDEGYMVFIPFNYNKKLRYHTSLGEDGYYDCRVYPFGVMFVRSSDAYENGLFFALGEPDKEIYYDEQYETAIVKSGNNTREFDVELELQGDPNIAVTTDVMNLRPKEDAKASRDAKIQKSKEVMKECGVPKKLWGKSGQELYFIVRDFMAGDYNDSGFISKEDAKAIVKYLNIMNFSDVPKIEGKIEDKSLQEKIVKKGNKWQVQSEKGKNLGTYDTKKEAEDRLKQVHYFKHVNEEVDFELPQYLYHATYKPFLKSIKEKGLGNTRRKMWSDSKGKGVVYLALDKDVAYSYAETAEWLDDVEDYDKYADNIIVLKIDTNKLDKSKFFKDENVLNDDSTIEYHGIIPFDAIVEVMEESIKHVDEDKHKDIIFKIDDTENINDNLTYVFVKVGIYGDNYYLPESLFVEYNNDTKEVILDTNRQCNKSILSKINYELNLDYDYVIKQLNEFIIDKKDSIERFKKAHKLLGEELQEVILSEGAFEDLSYIRDIDSDYIDVKELEDVTYKQLLDSDLVTPIDKLYHSTPISNLESIKQNGLRIDNKNLWSMSKSGRIYLALNPEESIDYVELAYQWGALDVEDVVLLEIPLSALDLNKLYIDTNEDENGYCVDGKLSLMSLEYRDNIPASNIKIVKTIKEEQDENLNESTGFPITVYTYQKPQVRELLENGETYIASYERANYSHYKDLSNLLGLSNCPIFGALSKKDLYAMLNSSGIDFEEENILHLEIPKENLHYMEYYDWTDYMYALDDAESFEEETGLSLQDLENLIKTQKSSIDYDECQVVFDRIEPQWYEDGKEEEEFISENEL